MVKIFVGNLPDGGLVTNDDLRPLFEAHGTVTECEVIKNYGFVHMDSEAASAAAIQELNGKEMKGRKMKVELSESKGGRQKNSQKLFVGNIADGTTSQELRSLFETYGEVLEADVISDKNYGFVHVNAGMGRSKIQKVITDLNGYELNGHKLRVQMSTSGVRQQAGGRGGGRGRGRRDAPYPPPRGGGYRDRGYSAGYSGYGEDYSRDYYGGGPMRGGDHYYSGYSGAYPEDNFAEDDMYARRPPPRGSRSTYASGSSGYGSSAYGAPPPVYDYGGYDRRTDYGGYAAGSGGYSGY